MVSLPAPSRVNQWVRGLRDKGRFLRNGGRDLNNEYQIGLLPEQGWQQRNIRYLRKVVFPSLFTKRTGDRSSPKDVPPQESGLTVTWIGHATFLISVDRWNILIDPNWAMWHSICKRMRRPGIALEDLPPIDYVLVTHAHYDHLHLRSLASIAQGQPILLPTGVSQLVKRFNLEALEMNWWDEVELEKGLRITFTPARHWGARLVHDLHRGFGGFVIQANGQSLYHCGDSAYFEGFSEIGQRFDIDVALLPIGAYDAPSGRPVHMNPEEAVDAFVDLNANRMVPMHFGSFPLGGEPMHEPLERLVYRAGSLGLSHRVQLLEEGQPACFTN